ncbi:MAG TPA: PQQ-dependent sugar dehydrogenase [Solirubrobacterales bacterium]|nr:PQQ-dependent sugar dehydrogenase [Solirubrobacterales bacterium]
MGRRAASCVAAAALALTAMPACGEAEERSVGPTAERDARDRGSAGASAARVALKRIGNFVSPVYVTGAPGFPRLIFVVEQAGTVRVMNDSRFLSSRPFLDIRGLVSSGGERGLLSIAFPPDYKQSRRFYVYFTDAEGDIRVEEFRRAGPTRAARGSRRLVIEIPHRANSNHNGGQLQFLGNHLYLGTGDGGSGGDPPNNAQDRESLLGKLLRIDPRPSNGRPYSVPADNPFVGRPGRDEIYSLGLRNPFRFSFDRVTSRRPRIAIADVGQDRFEEVDYIGVDAASGANFGWDAFEGFARYTGANSGTADPGGTVKPILTYGRDRGCTIIGGYVVGDPRLPALRGRYVYADLCEGELRSLVPHLRRASGDRRLGPRVSTPSSFGEDTRGRIYVASLEGPVFRLVAR